MLFLIVDGSIIGVHSPSSYNQCTAVHRHCRCFAVRWEQYVQHRTTAWACNERVTVPLGGVQARPAWCRYNKCWQTLKSSAFLFLFLLFSSVLPPPIFPPLGVQYIIEFCPPLLVIPPHPSLVLRNNGSTWFSTNSIILFRELLRDTRRADGG